MQLGWIGSRALGGGIALFVGGYVLMIAALPYGGLITGIGVATIASGAAALAISPRAPFTGRLARSGLGLVAVGAVSLVVSAGIAAGMTYDPLESMPVVLFGLAGLVLTPIGILVTLASLVRRFATSRS